MKHNDPTTIDLINGSVTAYLILTPHIPICLTRERACGTTLIAVKRFRMVPFKHSFSMFPKAYQVC